MQKMYKDIVRNVQKIKMSNYGELLYSIPTELINILINFERILKKLIMRNWSIKFNKTCLKENILPNFSNTCSSKFL